MRLVTIIPLSLGPVAVNTYILICRRTGQAAIIDPAAEPHRIIDTLASRGATPAMILNTHGHPDHLLANAALKTALDIPVWMHADDSGLYADSPAVDELERQTGLSVDTRADRLLDEGSPIQLGEVPIRVLHTPGHTPGSLLPVHDSSLESTGVGERQRGQHRPGGSDLQRHPGANRSSVVAPARLGQLHSSDRGDNTKCTRNPHWLRASALGASSREHYLVGPDTCLVDGP